MPRFPDSRKSRVGTVGRLLLLAICVLPMSAAMARAQDPAGEAHPPAQASQAKPPSDVYQLPSAKQSKAVRLSHERTVLHFVGALWSAVFLLLLLFGHAIDQMEGYVERITRRRWLQMILFLPMLLAIVALSNLPLDAVAQFLSRSYGLSVQGWPSWAGDQLKGLLLYVVTGTLLLMLVLRILHWSPRRWWLWFWVASIPIEIVSLLVIPVAIDPLFNRFEPLQATRPALTAQLTRVITRTGMEIPPQRMFLMKASEKYSGMNAYVTGFGASKRVVVWDTTADKLPSDQVLYIFGHELGHYVLQHIWKGMVFYSGVLLVFLWLAHRLLHGLLERYGDRWGVESEREWGVACVLMLLLAFFSFAAEPVTNTFSRYQEHQADIYGQEAVHGIVADPQATAAASFQALGEAWLEDPDPNWLVEFWTYSHPSVAERLRFAARYDPWAPGSHPRYFSSGEK